MSARQLYRASFRRTLGVGGHFVGCGLPQITYPCKPQIATDSYSTRKRNARRPGLGFDDACVLPKHRFHILSLKNTQNLPNSHRDRTETYKTQLSQGWMSKSGSVHVALSRSVLGMARGLLCGGLEGGFIYLPVPRLADQSTSSLWLRTASATHP